MTTIANANTAIANRTNPVVKIGDRKKLQGTHHKYIVNELGEYTCNYCEKTSKNQSTISEHISRLHASEAGRIVKPFQCPTCEKRFNSVSIRDQHIQNNHFNIRDSCVAPGCKYKGKSGSALCSHYARKHMDIDSMITMIDGEIAECNHCNKQLNKSSIIYHLARCNPVSPYCKSIQDSMRATANLGLEEEEELSEEEEILSEPEDDTRPPLSSEEIKAAVKMAKHFENALSIMELPLFKSKPCLKPNKVIVDLSNVNLADKICSPFGCEKVEKKQLIQAEPIFKKARKERTVRKPRKRTLVILEEIEEDEELLKEIALHKGLKAVYNAKKAEYDSAEIKDKELFKEAKNLKKMIDKSKQKIRDLKI